MDPELRECTFHQLADPVIYDPETHLSQWANRWAQAWHRCSNVWCGASMPSPLPCMACHPEAQQPPAWTFSPCSSGQ